MAESSSKPKLSVDQFFAQKQKQTDNQVAGLDKFFGDRLPPVKKETEASLPAPIMNSGNALTDTGFDLVKGINQIPSALTGAGDTVLGLAGLNRPLDKLTDKIGEATGYQPKKWAENIDNKFYSPERQIAESKQQALSTAYDKGQIGLGELAGKSLANPRVLGGMVAQSLPSMAVGGAGGNILKGLGAVKSLATGAAIGEGTLAAGQQMESIDKNVDPQRAATASAITGLGTIAASKLGNNIAEKFGLVDPDVLLAGGGLNAAGTSTLNPLLQRGLNAGKGAIAEGALEEAPQSMLEQASKNVAEGEDINQGLAQAGVSGLLTGGAMGGAVNAVSPTKPKPGQSDPTTDPAVINREGDFIPGQSQPNTPQSGPSSGNAPIDSQVNQQYPVRRSPLTGEQLPELTRESGALTRSVHAGAVDENVINLSEDIANSLYADENNPAEADLQQPTEDIANAKNQETSQAGQRQQEGLLNESAQQIKELPEPFLSPTELKQEEWKSKARERGITDEETLNHIVPQYDLDSVTGFEPASAKAPTVKRAMDYVSKTGQTAHFVEADISNLGGLNSYFKNNAEPANKVYRQISDIFAEEMANAGLKTINIRHGGDEFNSVVIGGTDQAVREAMQNAKDRVNALMKESGLDVIPHPKYKDDNSRNGVSLYLGHTNIDSSKTLDDIFNQSSQELNESKEKGANYVRRDTAAQTGNNLYGTSGNDGLARNDSQNDRRRKETGSEIENGNQGQGFIEPGTQGISETGSKQDQEQVTGLQSYTQADLEARDAKDKEQTKQQAKEDQLAEQKRKADNEIDTLADEMLGNIGNKDVFDNANFESNNRKKADDYLRSKTTNPKQPLAASQKEEANALGDEADKQQKALIKARGEAKIGTEIPNINRPWLKSELKTQEEVDNYIKNIDESINSWNDWTNNPDLVRQVEEGIEANYNQKRAEKNNKQEKLQSVYDNNVTNEQKTSDTKDELDDFFGDLGSFDEPDVIDNKKSVTDEQIDLKNRIKSLKDKVIALRKEASDYNKMTNGRAIKNKGKNNIHETNPGYTGPSTYISPSNENKESAHHRNLINKANEIQKEINALLPQIKKKEINRKLKLSIKKLSTKSSVKAVKDTNTNVFEVLNIPMPILDALGWKSVYYKPGIPQEVFAEVEGEKPFKFASNAYEHLFDGNANDVIDLINNRLSGETQVSDMSPKSISGTSSPLATSKEYHINEAENAYQHSNRYGAKAAQERYVNDINDAYDSLNKDLNSDQKAYLDKQFIDLKKGYLDQDMKALKARSGMVSSHIAGKSNFKSSLSTRGQSSYDSARSNLSKWFDSNISEIKSGISKLRDESQIKKDTELTDKKRKNKLLSSFLSPIQAMNDPGYDKSAFMGSAKKAWDNIVSESPEYALEIENKINDALKEQGTSLEKVLGSRSNLWKQIQAVKENQTSKKENADAVSSTGGTNQEDKGAGRRDSGAERTSDVPEGSINTGQQGNVQGGADGNDNDLLPKGKVGINSGNSINRTTVKNKPVIKINDSDDLLSAVSKIGGLDKNEAKSQGIDPAYFNKRGYGIMRIFNAGKNAQTFDQMAETLRQYGYELDGANSLLEKISLSLNQGEPFYNAKGYEALAELQANERFDDEQARLALEIENKIDDGLIDAEDIDNAIDEFDDGVDMGRQMSKQELDDFFGLNNDETTTSERAESNQEAAKTEEVKLTIDDIPKPFYRDAVIDLEHPDGTKERISADKLLKEIRAEIKAYEDFKKCVGGN
jgi:hypothetical protein